MPVKREANNRQQQIGVLRIWPVVWPILLYNLLEMTVGLADLMMVRPLGTDATAAVGVCRQITFLIEAVAIGITAGVTTRISQAFGAGDTQRVNRLVIQAVHLAWICAVASTLLGLSLSSAALEWLHVQGPARAQATVYLHFYFAGLVFSWATLMATAILRGYGDVRTPLRIAVGMNAANIVLNYLFIHGAGTLPALGVGGAALGTLLARAAAAVFFFLTLRHGFRIRATAVGAHVPRGLDSNELVQTLRLGVPLSGAALLRTGARLVYLSIVGTAFGTSLQAAVAIGMQLRLVGILPALAFQVTINMLVGQSIGKRNTQEARLVGQRAIAMLAGVVLVTTLGLVLLSEPLAGLVVKSQPDAALAGSVIRWFAVAQWFSAMAIGAQGILMGHGDTAVALRDTAVSQWCVLLPLAAGAAYFQDTPQGLLAAWLVAPAVILALFLLRIRHLHRQALSGTPPTA